MGIRFDKCEGCGQIRDERAFVGTRRGIVCAECARKMGKRAKRNGLG